MGIQRTFTTIVLVAALAGMVGTPFAETECAVLPPDSDDRDIEILKLKMMAETTQDLVNIDGHSQFEGGEYEETIERTASGYASADQIRVERSEDDIRVCFNAGNTQTK